MNILDIRKPMLDESKIRFADSTQSSLAVIIEQCPNDKFISIKSEHNNYSVVVNKGDVTNLIRALQHVQSNWND